MWPIVYPLLFALGSGVPRLMPATAPHWAHVLVTSLLVVGLMTMATRPR